VHQLIPSVHRCPGRLAQPDPVRDPCVGVADDDEGNEVLDQSQVQSVDVAEVDMKRSRKRGGTERLQTTAVIIINHPTPTGVSVGVNDVIDPVNPEDHGVGDAGSDAEEPDYCHDDLGRATGEELAEGVDDREEAVDGDDDEGDDTDVDGHLLDERRDGTE